MKFFWTAYFICMLFISIGISWMFLITHPATMINAKLSFSPLPSFLTLTANAQVTTLDVWNPQRKVVSGNIVLAPDLTAESALSYDISTNQLLYAKNANERHAMASLTKIMTAIVSLEHQKQDNKYRVTNESLVGEDSMGLVAGEILSLKELLYGAVLHSGNDAAMTMAINYPGGVEKFTQAMNQKATSLGLTNTHFTNPTGLEGDGNQYTTAFDLLVMTRFALDHFLDFREVVGTVEYVIPQTATHQEYDLENETNLLTSYPGVQGVKDGYTPEAGLCLVTYLNFQGHKIIGIILGSDNRRGDMKDLLDYSLKKEGITPPPHS